MILGTDTVRMRDRTYQMKGRPRSPGWCHCKDTMQIRSAATRDEAAELRASKVEGSSRRCCRPQIVLANSPSPSTTVARSNAIGTPHRWLESLLELRCRYLILSPWRGKLRLKAEVKFTIACFPAWHPSDQQLQWRRGLGQVTQSSPLLQ